MGHRWAQTAAQPSAGVRRQGGIRSPNVLVIEISAAIVFIVKIVLNKGP